VQAADARWRPDLITGVCHSRSAPPVHMSKLTATQAITPFKWVQSGRGEVSRVAPQCLASTRISDP
jgi:hypothetical protein